MKQVVAVLALASISFGCASSEQPAPMAPVQPIGKEILVVAGDINKPYRILGELTYVSEQHNIYNSYADAESAEVQIKSMAVAKYGSKVDGLIHCSNEGEIYGGYFGHIAAGFGAPVLVNHVRCVAVQFK